jgi:hypothetical protein
MTSLPLALPEAPLGIIIHNGNPRQRPASIWAYLWAEDEEDQSSHWHDVLPRGRTS